MEVGLYIRDYMDDTERLMYQQVEEAAEVCRRAKSLGFSVICMPQHYIPIQPRGCRRCKRWPDWLQRPRA